MAARALAAAGRRMAGRTGSPLLASCRIGAKNRSSSAQPEEQKAVHDDHGARAITGAQVEAALNRKNVEVLQAEERVATVLPDEAVGGAPEGEDVAWVPDHETGVFGPADTDNVSTGGPPAPPHTTATGVSSSVLDQAVFVREEAMEDVERPPAIDMANANAK